jgi:hypothetical protein
VDRVIVVAKATIHESTRIYTKPHHEKQTPDFVEVWLRPKVALRDQGDWLGTRPAAIRSVHPMIVFVRTSR